MKIDIKHRKSGEVIFSYEQENNSIKITLEAAVSANTDLRRADLREAYLAEAYLVEADLYGADLGWANLRGADLRRSDLSRADLRGADLVEADLRGANLDEADLRGAILHGAILHGAILHGADLRGAYLRGATYGIATLEKGVLSISGKHWPIYIFDAHINIGCRLHSTADWETFSDEQISEMADGALEFWHENKEVILAIAKQHQNKSGE